MKIFKRMAIKSVTKKWTKEILEVGGRGLMNASHDSTIEEKNEYILAALVKYIKDRNLDTNCESVNPEDWEIVHRNIVVEEVLNELSYDKSMGTDKDMFLLLNTFKKEMVKLVS
jgi:hypothetical protein